MNLTRVDTKKLKTAVEKATGHIEQAAQALKPFLVVLTDDARASTQRARDGFPDAGRTLASAMTSHPTVAAASGFEADAVVEDLDNVAVLKPLAAQVAELSQLLADSTLTWLAEAWVPSLAAYAVAKVQAKTNGALRALVDPIAAIFATNRAQAAKPAK